jgi:hypothetical protein
MEVYQDDIGDDFYREKNVAFAVTEQLEGLEYALSSCWNCPQYALSSML